MADTIDPGALAAPGTEPGADTARIDVSGVLLLRRREPANAPVAPGLAPRVSRRTIPFDPYGRPAEERW